MQRSEESEEDEYEVEEGKGEGPPSPMARRLSNSLDITSVQWMQPLLKRQFKKTALNHCNNVGVEIEIPGWFVETKGTTSGGWAPLRGTHDPIVSKVPYFELQAELSGRLEFVTDPPVTAELPPPKNLLSAVGYCAAIAQDVCASTTRTNKSYERIGPREFNRGMPTLAKEGITVRRPDCAIARLENKQTLVGQFQVTAGIHPAGIYKFVSECSRIGSTPPSEMTSIARRRVDEIIVNTLGTIGHTPYRCVSPELEGLLLLVHYYLAVFEKPTLTANPTPPKGQVDCMVRTDFASVFSLCPEYDGFGGASLTYGKNVARPVANRRGQKSDWVALALGDLRRDVFVINQVFDGRPIPSDADEIFRQGHGWPVEIDANLARVVEQEVFHWPWKEYPSIHATYVQWKSAPRDDQLPIAITSLFVSLRDALNTSHGRLEAFLQVLDNAHKDGRNLSAIRFFPLFRVAIDIRRDEWLNGMLEGTDFLSQRGCGASIMKTMGELSMVDDLGGGHGVILELRKFNQDLPPDKWVEFASRAATFVAQVNVRMRKRDRKRAKQELELLHKRSDTVEGKEIIAALVKAIDDCVFREQAWGLVRRGYQVLERDARERSARVDNPKVN